MFDGPRLYISRLASSDPRSASDATGLSCKKTDSAH